MALTDALTRSYGPLPGWAWAGVVGAGIWLLLPRLRGSSSATPGRATATPGPDATYGLGYAQGLQSAGANAPAPSRSGAAGTTATNSEQVPIYLRSQPGPQGVAALLAPGASVPAAGAPVTGGSYTTPSGLTSNQWQPVTYSGTTLYAPAIQVRVADAIMAGLGGAAALGSRSAEMMSPWHPLVTTGHRYPHFVRAVGGAPNHTREVHRVAEQAGVHPARVMMMNPHPTGWLRVA
jgi:hypothetical protein